MWVNGTTLPPHLVRLMRFAVLPRIMTLLTFRYRRRVYRLNTRRYLFAPRRGRFPTQPPPHGLLPWFCLVDLGAPTATPQFGDLVTLLPLVQRTWTVWTKRSVQLRFSSLWTVPTFTLYPYSPPPRIYTFALPRPHAALPSMVCSAALGTTMRCDSSCLVTITVDCPAPPGYPSSRDVLPAFTSSTTISWLRSRCCALTTCVLPRWRITLPTFT